MKNVLDHSDDIARLSPMTPVAGGIHLGGRIQYGMLVDGDELWGSFRGRKQITDRMKTEAASLADRGRSVEFVLVVTAWNGIDVIVARNV